jgi:CHAT domain-containing protein
MCVGTSLKPLLKNNIEPDIVVTMDGNFANYKHFKNLTYQPQSYLFTELANHHKINDNWNNKSLVGSHNDGILTAEEISFLDLSGVELVVLSACDTGLGDVSNLEGINGLQRAFKLAGAKKLIMSLWKVPDKETAEFFKHFYKFLLEDERSINESFRYTQKIMNEKYEPYYWASFVLLE